MAQPPGIHARRAALRLLDAVLRRGETLDVAFGAATSDIRKFEDKALARAIASEALRWLVDLDTLIDSLGVARASCSSAASTSTNASAASAPKPEPRSRSDCPASAAFPPSSTRAASSSTGGA